MIPVPGNSSRLFTTYSEAITQPIGYLNFGLAPTNSMIINDAYNPDLIRYDQNYSTVNETQLSNSFMIFRPTLEKFFDSMFIDIGCGQGEFVRKIREFGCRAVGFDPVLQNPSDGLYKRLFDAESLTEVQDLSDHKVFIMRCVLPHIQNPWNFLDVIFDRFPHSLVVLQHQNFPKLISNGQWNLLMHDHVNLFRLVDFRDKYHVVEHSEFADSEWDQVILSKGVKHVGSLPQNEMTDTHARDLAELSQLIRIRETHIEVLSQFSDVWIYGAAGKGINFAFALTQSGVRITGALDENQSLSGKFLECSGVEIFSFSEFIKRRINDSLVVVMNQNHLENARSKIGHLARTVGIKDLVCLPLQ